MQLCSKYMSCDFVVYILNNCVFSTCIDPNELRKVSMFTISWGNARWPPLITVSLKIAISLATIGIESNYYFDERNENKVIPAIYALK